MVSKKSKDTTETILKYNSETLKSLLSRRPNLNEFVELIKDLLKDEGCNNSTDFNEEECINLDEIEIFTAKKNKTSDIFPSMDFTVGLDQNRLMLVEAKFRVKNVDNICSQLKDKIKRSTFFMRDELSCCVHKDLVILLSQSPKIEQQKSKLRRQMNNVIGIKPMSAMDFHRLYFE